MFDKDFSINYNFHNVTDNEKLILLLHDPGMMHILCQKLPSDFRA
jgi:hypothetical protein